MNPAQILKEGRKQAKINTIAMIYSAHLQRDPTADESALMTLAIEDYKNLETFLNKEE